MELYGAADRELCVGCDALRVHTLVVEDGDIIIRQPALYWPGEGNCAA